MKKINVVNRKQQTSIKKCRSTVKSIVVCYSACIRQKKPNSNRQQSQTETVNEKDEYF